MADAKKKPEVEEKAEGEVPETEAPETSGADTAPEEPVVDPKEGEGDAPPGVEDKPEEKPEEESEGKGETSDQEMSDLIAALAEHNINLDVDAIKSPRDFMKHLTIALHALKGNLQPAAGGQNAPVEEQPSATLSHDSVDPKVAGLQAKLAESELKHIVSRIDSLVANGQAPGHVAKKWVSSLTEHQLGLIDEDPSTDIAVIKSQIDFVSKNVPRGTLFTDEAKKLAEKNGTSNLSADELAPVETQKWGDNSLDPDHLKKVAEKFLKDTNLI